MDTLNANMDSVRNEKEVEIEKLRVELRTKNEELSLSKAYHKEMMTLFASNLDFAKQCLELKTKVTELRLLADAARSDKVKAEADGAEKFKRAEKLDRESDEKRREAESLLEKVQQEREWAHQERNLANQERQPISSIMEEMESRSGRTQDSIDLSRKELQNTLEDLQDTVKQGGEVAVDQLQGVFQEIDRTWGEKLDQLQHIIAGLKLSERLPLATQAEQSLANASHEDPESPSSKRPRREVSSGTNNPYGYNGRSPELS